jgi:hypothetical protein
MDTNLMLISHNKKFDEIKVKSAFTLGRQDVVDHLADISKVIVGWVQFVPILDAK